MSIETNKALATRFCQLISDRNLDALFMLFHDDGSWTIPYREDRFPFAGFRNKAAIREMLTGFLGGFTAFTFSIENLTAEGNRVSIEARSTGTGPKAAPYENVYHMYMEIQDGQVHTIREYFDPYQVMAYVEQIS